MVEMDEIDEMDNNCCNCPTESHCIRLLKLALRMKQFYMKYECDENLGKAFGECRKQDVKFTV